MKVKKLPLGPLETNCYVVHNQNTALIFDPGGEGEKLMTWLKDKKLTPVAILLTHAHFDHIGAVDEIREHYDIPVYVHQAEKDWLEDPNLNGSALFAVGEIKTGKGADYLFKMGDQTIGDFSFELRHTPGHSPGGIICMFQQDKFVIGGDSLFQLGIGRTDLPGGDHHQLLTSIKSEMFTLPDDYTVYPGHGEETTIGAEKRHNPFLN